MHVFGHVMIWLIAIGAVGASILSAKSYDIRNSWIKKVDQLKQDVEKNKPTIAEKEHQLDVLREELDRTILGWGRPFNNVGGQLNNNFQFTTQDPDLTLWLGSLDQNQQAAQVMYVFQPKADGKSSLYIGAFQLAAAVQPGGNALFNPTWSVRPDDFAAIENPNGPFRIWPLVPSYFPSTFADIRGEIALSERYLADKAQDLKDQEAREMDATEILQKRNDQLQGQNGVVDQLQQSEDERNVQLEELDFWRRQVDQARQKIENLEKANRDLEQQLHQTPSGNQPEITTQVTSR